MNNTSACGNSRDYTTQSVSDLESAIKECLKLRKGEHQGTKWWSFRGQRDESWDLGLHNIDKFPCSLELLLNQFKHRCMEFPPQPYLNEKSDWYWMFFAQHHRLKTRLLDWTKDPLVAVYFAVENIISGKNDKTCGAVWALHVNERNFKTASDLRDTNDPAFSDWGIINPPPFIPRITRQSSLFTYHPPEESYVPINRRARREGEYLVKIQICLEACEAKYALKEIRKNCPGIGQAYPSESIREQLGIMNTHHAALFPDPQGVAEFVNKQWPDIGKL